MVFCTSGWFRFSLRLVLAFSPVLIWAQGSSVGNITGVVSDPSGSAIPGAGVVIRNVNTNQNRQTSTNSSGLYSLTSLPVGTYELNLDPAYSLYGNVAGRAY